jgi:hypothetical protein
MSEFTNYLEGKIIDHMLRNQAYTPPTTVYLGLFTSAPSDAGGGTEVSGGSYARQAVALTAASGAGASENSADITFPQATADWGTVTHCALFDAVSGGNMLMYTPLDASKTVNNGDTFKINASDLDIVID